MTKKLAGFKYLYSVETYFIKPSHISVMFYLHSSQKYFSRFLRTVWNNSYKIIRMNIKSSLPIYYYQYSALGLVWAGTRAQSGDRHGFGTLHPAQVFRGSLTLLSPACRRPHSTSAKTRESLAAKGVTMGEKVCPVILPTWRLYSRHQGSSTCGKSTTWDRRLYFPSEGRREKDFFALKNPKASAGYEPANLGIKGQHATLRSPQPLL